MQGARPSGAARRARDLLSEMFHPQKTVAAQPRAERRRAIRRLARPGRRLRREPLLPRRAQPRLLQHRHRPDARRWRGRSHAAHRERWDVDDAMAVCRRAHADRYLEVKAVGIEVRGALSPGLHAARCWRDGNAGSSATTRPTGRRPTRSCGSLIGPLLLHDARRSSPQMRCVVEATATCGFGVRRSSALLRPMRRGHGASISCTRSRRASASRRERPDPQGGRLALREAGKVDATRLERHLRANVAVIPARRSATRSSGFRAADAPAAACGCVPSPSP